MDRNHSALKFYGLYGSAGVQFAASVAIGIAIGYYLDGRTELTPLFTIIGLVVGSVSGFYNLMKIIGLTNSADKGGSNGSIDKR